MKNVLFCIVGCLVVMSCGRKEAAEKESVKPVKVILVQSMNVVTKNYAGLVQSDQVSNLAFRVSGQILNLAVDEGDKVKQGQLIAEIDTRDYKLQYEVNRSAYITAKAQYERFQRLLEKEAISKQDYEIAETNYDKAKAAFENSQNVLHDSRLLAPFNGTIERKMVDNYQRVNAGEPIVRLVNTSDLYVSFNMADYNLNILKSGRPEFSVCFNSLGSVYYNAKIREFTDISTDGSGIPVSLWINDPNFNNRVVIKPGFACDVKVEFHFDNADNFVFIPISAIFVNPKTGKKTVWVVKDNKLEGREVQFSTLEAQDQVAVVSGLKGGEQIIVAGAVTLTEGQKVRVLN